jgi:hypothetical protein
MGFEHPVLFLLAFTAPQVGGTFYWQKAFSSAPRSLQLRLEKEYRVFW